MSNLHTKQLDCVSPGNRGKVISLDGGIGFRDQMNQKGLIEGVIFKTRSAGRRGPVVVEISGNLLEIGFGQAQKVTVVEYSKIKDLQPGQRGCVVGFDSPDDEYRHKLLRMGIIKGAEFTLIRKAPLGDPLEIKLGDYNLTLRRDEAEAIDIVLQE